MRKKIRKSDHCHKYEKYTKKEMVYHRFCTGNQSGKQGMTAIEILLTTVKGKKW